MKKVLCSILCVALVLGMSSIFTFADTPSKSETFVADLIESKSISLEVDGEIPVKITEGFSITISNAKACIIDGDFAITATVAGIINIKVVAVDGDVYVCIPNWYLMVNLAAIFGEEAINLQLFEDLWQTIAEFEEVFDYMKYDGVEEDVDGYDVETFVPDLKAAVLAWYSDSIPEGVDIEAMTDLDLMAYLAESIDAADFAKLELYMDSSVKFYYAAGTDELKNIVAEIPNEDGTALETIDVAAMIEDKLDITIGAIGTNVEASELSIPVAIDISVIVRYIVSLFV